MLKKLNNLLKATWFFLRTGISETKLTAVYAQLARLDYREPRFASVGSDQVALTTMSGGPTIFLPAEQRQYILKYSNEKRELYIQEPWAFDPDGWRTVYRTGKVFIRGPWLRIMKQLAKKSPYVPNRSEGFV